MNQRLKNISVSGELGQEIYEPTIEEYELDKFAGAIKRMIILIQKGRKYKNKPHEIKSFVDEVNKVFSELLKQCEKCSIPYYKDGFHNHIKICNGIPKHKLKQIKQSLKVPPRYCKECNIPIPKGKQHCKEHTRKWDRPSYSHIKCKECDVTKPKRWFAKGHFICTPCNSKLCNGKAKHFTYLGKELSNLLTLYRTSKNNQEKAIKEKIPQHKLNVRTIKKELSEFEKRVDKERRAIVYRYRAIEGRVAVNKNTIKKRKVRHKKWERDIAQHIVNNFPPTDYSNKYDWTKSMYDVTKLVSKQYGIKITVLKKLINDTFGFKGTEYHWVKHIDDKVKELQPNYTGKAPWILECLECGDEHEYPKRLALIRALGLGGSDDKKYAGYCEKCGQSQPQSDEMKRKCRESHLKNLGFDTWEDYEENVFVMGEYKTYASIVRVFSSKNLRDYKPEEYKRLKSNPYISKSGNYETGLTIEHLKPVSEGWRKRIPIKEISHTNNLTVITMKENNKSWQEYVINKNINND